MYNNPKYIRTHEIKVRLNDDEYDLLERITNSIGAQKAAYTRELAMTKLKELLEGLDTKTEVA